MKITEINISQNRYKHYIDLIGEADIYTALRDFGTDYLKAQKEKYIALANKRYAPDKWTINDILQHIIDTERIFAYRALRFARADSNSLAGFDENFYALQANADNRSVESLIQEFSHVRNSTICLFETFSQEEFLRSGTASGNPLSVAEIGFIIVGHFAHHAQVIEQRYDPLLQ